MSRQEMACGECHAPLNVLGDPPSYIHPLSFTTDGHQPQPVPAQELETIARRCDFCGHNLPVWTTEATDAVAVVAYDHAGGGLAQDYGHAWAACAPCEQLTANRDLDGLAARAAAAMGWKDEDQAVGHIAQFHAAFLNQSPTRRRLITTTAWPPGAITARELPKVRDRLVRLYQGGDQLPAPYTDKLRQQLADGLLAARLYWIDTEFTTLAGHATTHLPEITLDRDELPATSGLLIWAQPVTDRQIAASSWHLDTGTGSCRIVCYRHIGTGLHGPALQRLREQVGWLAPTRLVEVTAGRVLAAGGPAAPLVATWLLIAQKAAEAVPAELDRATRRAYARQQRPAPEVHVVRIRARTANPFRVRGSSSAGRGRGPLTRREWVGVTGSTRRMARNAASVDLSTYIHTSEGRKAPRSAPPPPCGCSATPATPPTPPRRRRTEPMPQMFTRVLYTPAGTKPDFGAGRTKAALLVADATVDDLRLVVEEGWLADQPACCPACHDPIHSTCHQQVRDVYEPRREVARRLDELLAAAGATFGSWQVDRYRIDQGEQPGVEAHTTGGPDGEHSTQAYRAWDILVDHHRLPTGWGAAICHAVGLIDPYADGTAAATVTFRSWQ